MHARTLIVAGAGAAARALGYGQRVAPQHRLPSTVGHGYGTLPPWQSRRLYEARTVIRQS
nr:hypothetical protein [Deltaproteobacteria bacterium]